jgi:PilZ domain-containing protein
MPAEEDEMEERRKTPRHRTLKAGSIALTGASRIDCSVRNLSQSGAMLEVVSPLGIPEEFVLVIANDHVQQPCHVVWRTTTRLGVEFKAA